MWKKGIGLLFFRVLILTFCFITFVKAQDQPGVLTGISTEDVTNPLLEATATWDRMRDPKAPPNPLPGYTADDASWDYFWMWDDGVFVKDQKSTFRKFNVPGTNRERTVLLALRGRYTSDDEPPPKRLVYNVPNTFPNTTNTAIPEQQALPDDVEIRLIPQSNAAIVGDYIFFAARIKNQSETGGRDANLRILFSSDSLLYSGTPFPTAAPEQINYPASTNFPASSVSKWSVENFGAREERTLFFKLQVKPRKDTSGVNLIFADLQWSDDNDIGVNSNILGYNQPEKDKSVQQPNPIYFQRETSTAIAINKGRDPNSLEVFPIQVAPAEQPAYELLYTVNVENIGSAAIHEIEVVCTMDPRLDMSSLSLLTSSLEIGDQAPPSGASLTKDPAVGNTIKFRLNGITLNVPGSAQNRGSFKFNINTKNNQALRAGDIIASHAIIRLQNNGMDHDEVETKPAITKCAVPGRIPFGSIIGVKIHHFIANTERSEGQGASLTYMIPLLNPRGNSIFNRYLRQLPRLWYQAEIGYGKGGFQNIGSGRTEMNYIHFNPLQIRGVFKSNLPASSIAFYWGVSLGYSADFITKAVSNGTDLPLSSNISDRVEHEIAFSIDALNIMTSPGLSLSVGYKYRLNNLPGYSTTYGFPYLSAQYNIFRFRRNFMQLQNNVYYR